MPYLIGNTTLKILALHRNGKITNASAPFLKNMVTRSYIQNVFMEDTMISLELQQEIETLLLIPLDERDIYISSKTKSASKISHPE